MPLDEHNGLSRDLDHHSELTHDQVRVCLCVQGHTPAYFHLCYYFGPVMLRILLRIDALTNQTHIMHMHSNTPSGDPEFHPAIDDHEPRCYHEYKPSVGFELYKLPLGRLFNGASLKDVVQFL